MTAPQPGSRRSVLVVCRTAPYGRSRARDAVDVAMALAAFEQPLTLLFLGDGVLALVRGQHPAQDFARSLEKLLGTLPDYGIEQIHADADALAAHGLGAGDLALAAHISSAAALRELFASHDVVLTV